MLFTLVGERVANRAAKSTRSLGFHDEQSSAFLIPNLCVSLPLNQMQFSGPATKV